MQFEFSSLSLTVRDSELAGETGPGKEPVPWASHGDHNQGRRASLWVTKQVLKMRGFLFICPPISHRNRNESFLRTNCESLKCSLISARIVRYERCSNPVSSGRCNLLLSFYPHLRNEHFLRNERYLHLGVSEGYWNPVRMAKLPSWFLSCIFADIKLVRCCLTRCCGLDICPLTHSYIVFLSPKTVIIQSINSGYRQTGQNT